MKNIQDNHKLWGGAFDISPKDKVIDFTSGRDMKGILPADEILFPYDIETNKAHAKMLMQQKIISEDEYSQLKNALDEILELHKSGEFTMDPALEDCHTNIENYLITKLGIDVGGKIHTARSRNDQTVSDMFLLLHDNAKKYSNEINSLIDTLSKLSKKYENTICPGYTHHQHATVTTFGKILDSFATALKRDLFGFRCLQEKFNYSPLGAVTSYGTTFPISPEIVAKELGYEKPFLNSIDTVRSRGEFEYNFAFNVCSLLDHLSSLAQTLIIFSTTEFSFIKLSDEYSTGSSIMPQKKNPDPLEVIKGKTGYAHGVLMGLLSMHSSSFIGYNRDSQQSKYMVMDLIAETIEIPSILAGLLDTMKINLEEMEKQCYRSFITATGLMELIIQNKKVPMRLAKKLIEQAIKLDINKGNNDKVSLPSLMQAIRDLNINIELSESELDKWQDPYEQVKLIK